MQSVVKRFLAADNRLSFGG